VRASPTRWLQSENGTTKKKFVLPFFPPNEMPAPFPVQRNNADDFSIRRPCATLQKHDGRRVGGPSAFTNA
jgi:hypothetical protein